MQLQTVYDELLAESRKEQEALEELREELASGRVREQDLEAYLWLLDARSEEEISSICENKEFVRLQSVWYVLTAMFLLFNVIYFFLQMEIISN